MEKADPKNRFLNDLWGQLYYGHPLWHNYKSIFSTSCLSFTLHVHRAQSCTLLFRHYSKLSLGDSDDRMNIHTSQEIGLSSGIVPFNSFLKSYQPNYQYLVQTLLHGLTQLQR